MINTKSKIVNQALFWAKSAKHNLLNNNANSAGKPTVINFLANDICNSKCTMCNIWEQKKDVELSPIEFGEILKDTLYTHVKHVGITGGEPTLREDLPQLVEVICETLPKLRAVSIITNAIKEEQVLSRIKHSIKKCKKYNKGFSVMISLDGYGNTHDEHRGVKGNFQSAMSVIDTLRQDHPEIPISIGCTITKLNVWRVDHLLDFLIEKDIYGRFRIGEFITRLYNDDNTTTIRNFNEDEIYHLSCFFTRLIRTFESNPKYQLTYQNIIGMLNGKKRTIGCPYHGDATVLDCRGDILYCAPKSNKIGNATKASAGRIYHDHLNHLEEIKKKHCQDCIHDYHFYTRLDILKPDLKRKYFNLIFSIKGRRLLSTIPLPKKIKKEDQIITITGWFGTETVGDKAILGGIVLDIKERYVNPRIVISSIYPFVTQRTIQELDIDAEVVDIYSRAYIDQIAQSDEVIMGGGPLMDLDVLGIPLTSFKIAKKLGIQTTIMGCGLGPLFIKKYIKATKEILRLTDDIRLRDNKSVQLAKTWLPQANIRMSGDYAFSFVQHRSQFIRTKEQDNYIACFLREWSPEYQDTLSDLEFQAIKSKFEEKIFKDLGEMSKMLDMPIKLFCMHTFTVGGDDRIFYRSMAERYKKDDVEIHIDEFPSSVDGIIGAMKGAKINICMRFHSVLFAESLGLDYVAIDYTNGGKISNLLDDLNKKDKYFQLLEYTQDDDISLIPALNGLQ